MTDYSIQIDYIRQEKSLEEIRHTGVRFTKKSNLTLRFPGYLQIN